MPKLYCGVGAQHFQYELETCTYLFMCRYCNDDLLYVEMLRASAVINVMTLKRVCVFAFSLVAIMCKEFDV